NWSVGAEQIPYIIGGFASDCGFTTGPTCQEQIERFKQTNRDLSGFVAYPFNRSDRVEFSAGLEQVAFAHEVRTLTFNTFTGNLIGDSTDKIPVHGDLNLAA